MPLIRREAGTMFPPPATESKDKLENCRVGVPTVHGYHDDGWVHGMDTMGQLLKENYDPLKRIFGVWGQTLGPHLILLPVFLLLSVSLAEIRHV